MMRSWLWLGLAGCGYRVVLTSVPQVAEVVLPNGEALTTPCEAVFRWTPYRPQWVTVRAPGHRELRLDLSKAEIKAYRFLGGTIAHPATLWGRPRGEVKFLLVPEHGPVGTWDE